MTIPFIILQHQLTPPYIIQPLLHNPLPLILLGHPLEYPNHLRTSKTYRGMLKGITSSSDSNTGNSLYHISHFISYYNLSPHHRTFSLKLSSQIEPNSYSKDILDPQLARRAINNELQSLINNNTWDLTPLPPNKRAI